MISGFKKIVCHTCGQPFAVTEDLLRSRQWMGRYSLICPLGHYTQFSNRSIDGFSLVEDLRRRVAQLENPLAVLPLEHTDMLMSEEEKADWVAKANQARAEIEAASKWEPPKHLVGKVSPQSRKVAEEIKAAKPKRDKFGQYAPSATPLVTPKRPLTRGEQDKLKDPPGKCPYCDKELGRPRKHARDMHKAIYKREDFV